MVTDSDLDKLRSLQEIIYEKIGLEKNIQEIPKLLSTQEELLNRLKKTFIEKNSEYEKIKAEELTLKTNSAKLNPLEKNPKKIWTW